MVRVNKRNVFQNFNYFCVTFKAKETHMLISLLSILLYHYHYHFHCHYYNYHNCYHQLTSFLFLLLLLFSLLYASLVDRKSSEEITS